MFIRTFGLAALLAASSALVAPALASPFSFSTGNPDGRIATATRPGSGGSFEIESADDFVLTDLTKLQSATFTGLIPSGSSVQNVVVEIYRVFPKDSDVGRTSGAPTFSTSQVPTRANSPSDVAFDSRDSASSGLTFSTNVLAAAFAAANSVQPGGIHPIPNVNTGGNGAVSGQEVELSVSFTSPFSLPADHYFFVPQVQLSNGDFLWLSAPRPIVPPGTPFPPGVTDLQSWTRDEGIDPDWLRVGADIVGGTTFNAAFSLAGVTIPEPAGLALVALGLAGMAAVRRKLH
jgi:hypothetical protein